MNVEGMKGSPKLLVDNNQFMITIVIILIIVLRDIMRNVKVEESYPADPVISEAFIHMCGQAQVVIVIIIIMREKEEKKKEEEKKEVKEGKDEMKVNFNEWSM